MIEWVPAASVVELHAALPLETTTAPQPAMDAPPSRKFTVPVATPAEPVTLALKVIDCPAVEGLRDDVSDTLAFAFTTWVIGDDVPGL